MVKNHHFFLRQYAYGFAFFLAFALLQRGREKIVYINLDYGGFCVLKNGRRTI